VLNGTDLITVAENVFDATPRGIDGLNVTNSRFENNLCYDFWANSTGPTTSVGISLENTGTGANNVVLGNTVNSASQGIYANCPDTIIASNDVLNFNSFGGYVKGIWCYTSALRSVVGNNKINGNGHANGAGIVIEASQFTVTGNLVVGCPSSGIYIVNGLDDYTVSGNVLKTCGGSVYGNGAHKFADTSHNVAD
jgi:hypothetical protein